MDTTRDVHRSVPSPQSIQRVALLDHWVDLGARDIRSEFWKRERDREQGKKVAIPSYDRSVIGSAR